jgi:hypothetical protein
MSTRTAKEVRRSPINDQPPWDIIFGCETYLALAVAVELKLLTSHDLARFSNGRYSLTPLAAKYLTETSPTYLGEFISTRSANETLFSVTSLRKAVLTDSPQAYAGGDMLMSHCEQAELARSFTRAMLMRSGRRGGLLRDQSPERSPRARAS